MIDSEKPMVCYAFQWYFPIPSRRDWLADLVRLLYKGTVKLNSPDPMDPLNININFF